MYMLGFEGVTSYCWIVVMVIGNTILTSSNGYISFIINTCAPVAKYLTCRLVIYNILASKPLGSKHNFLLHLLSLCSIQIYGDTYF